jgi:hypothetical protein
MFPLVPLRDRFERHPAWWFESAGGLIFHFKLSSITTSLPTTLCCTARGCIKKEECLDAWFISRIRS